MATEIGYWASLSGLTPANRFSLPDHQRAAMTTLTSSTDAPTIDDLKYRYYKSVAPGSLDQRLSVIDYEREYYISQLGGAATLRLLSTDDLKSRFLDTQ
jgi:hypothetical protein